MADVLDYRSVIEQKLSTKYNELGRTEESLKKFASVERGSAKSHLFRNRLGPAVRNGNGDGGGGRHSLRARLGPKVEPREAAGADGDNDQVEGKDRVMSRVFIEQKSREEAISEQKTDKREVMRNRRMFGSIMGTLQGFVRDENKVKEKEKKKREIEKKIEKRTEEEKKEVVREKEGLWEEKRRKQREIKVLQLQMTRVEEFEAWEKSKRSEMGFIKTTKAASNIYFAPKKHNESTNKAVAESNAKLEEEISAAKEQFEQELLKINSRLENPNLDVDDESEDDEEVIKNLSVVSAIQRPQAVTEDAVKRPESKKEPIKKEPRVKDPSPKGQDSPKRSGSQSEASKHPSDDKKEPKKRRRRDSSSSSDSDSSTDSSSDSSSSSGSSSSDDGESKKKKIRKK